MTGGQIPTGMASSCKYQDRNNQCWQFGVVNGFFLPVSYLLDEERRGKAGGLLCFGSDASTGVSAQLSALQAKSGFCWQERRERQRFTLPP